MCVAISLLPGATLTEEEVFKMNRTNGDGCGFAWARGGVVQWVKTTRVNPTYITEMVAAYKDLPRLLHFRLATAGGTKVELCHPFEIGPLANCAQTGKSGRVLIHNGHFNRWKELFELSQKEDLLPDKGPWSDSRLIAWWAHLDLDWLQMLTETGKVAVLDGDGQLYHMGSGWQDLREGVKVSNYHWKDKDYAVGGYPGYREWPGWFNTDEDWERWAEYEAKVAAEEERKAIEAAAASKQLVQVKEYSSEAPKRLDVIRERASGGTSDPNGASNPGSYRRTIWEKEVAERAAERKVQEAARAARKTHRPGRAYSDEPWTDPETGNVYRVSQSGRLVKVASAGDAVEPGSRITQELPVVTASTPLNSDTPTE